MVEVGELESYLTAQSDVGVIIVTVVAKNARDGGGCRRGLVFTKRREGTVVGQSQGGMRLCKKIRKMSQGTAGSHQVHEREAKQAVGDHGAEPRRRVGGKFLKTWWWKTGSRRWKLSCSRQVKK